MTFQTPSRLEVPALEHASTSTTEYESIVEDFRRNRRQNIILNAAPEHDCIVFTQLFEYAKQLPLDEAREIRIYASRITSMFSDHFSKYIDELFSKNIKIRLLLDPPAERYADSEFVSRLFSNHDLGEIRALTEKDYLNNYIFVVGQSAFRWEPCRNRIETNACFNDRVTAAWLTREFDSAWNNVANPLQSKDDYDSFFEALS